MMLPIARVVALALQIGDWKTLSKQPAERSTDLFGTGFYIIEFF
jgi:hypothetical protein